MADLFDIGLWISANPEVPIEVSRKLALCKAGQGLMCE